MAGRYTEEEKRLKREAYEKQGVEDARITELDRQKNLDLSYK